MTCACNDPGHYHRQPTYRERAVAEAQQAVTDAEAFARAARENLRRIKQESFPEEPHQKIIEFSLKFNRTGRIYNYAAIKVNTGIGGPSKWYVTGQDDPYTWKELVRYIESKYIHITPTVVMTGEPVLGFIGLGD